MKGTRKRGRPRLYHDTTKQPVFVGIRLAHDLEAQLRANAQAQECTLTSLIVQAILSQQEHDKVLHDHGNAVQQLDEFRVALAALEKKYATLEKQYTKLEKRVTSLFESNKQLKKTLRTSEKKLRETEGEVERLYERLYRYEAFGSFGNHQTNNEKIPPHVLRGLAKLIHPDKWAQGQLATELAHEASVFINRYR
jgi:chromosome segregation ATPase